MKKLLLALALTLAPTYGWAQCSGVFPPNTVCGNYTASPATPKATVDPNGTVSPGLAGEIAYYPSNGSTVDGTTALPNGTTATTQATTDNSTKVATTAFVNSNVRPSLTPNVATVKVAPYATVAAGAANYGPVGGETSFEFLIDSNLYRIRQDGNINRFKINLPSITGITGFYIKVWRQHGTTYDLVGSTADLVGSITTGINTFNLGTTIPAKYGDRISVRAEYSGGATVQNFDRDAGSASTLYAVSNATPSTTQYNWAAQTATASSVLIVEVYMDTAPVFVAIGDSITSGDLSSLSFCDNPLPTPPTDITTSYPYVLGLLTGYTSQNCGVSAQTTTQIAARFAADVVAMSPRMVIINGGVNDILAGTNNATIIANITAMLDAAIAADIIPVVLGVTPFQGWGVSTPTMYQQADALNPLIEALVTAAPYNGIYVDPSPMGKYYPTGDANNLWTLAYPTDPATDTIHPSPAGKKYLAQLVYNAIQGTNVDAAFRPGAINVQSGYYYYFDGQRFIWTHLLNTYLGYNAGNTSGTGTSNTGVGYQAFVVNTTGTNNTGLGTNVGLVNTTGGSLTAIGSSALAANTTGSRNTAVGSGALIGNTVTNNNTAVGEGAFGGSMTAGGNNVGVGYQAGKIVTTGQRNTFVGPQVGIATTTGSFNTALGGLAFGANITNSNNVAVGDQALLASKSDSNTALGYAALYQLTTGGHNIALGYTAGAGITTGSYNVIIGEVTGLTAALANNIIIADGQGNQRARYNSGWALSDAGTSPALSSCGTTPAISGSDFAGTVTMGTGAPTGCVITFAAAKAAAPHCVVTWRATPLASQSYTISTTAITLTQTATSSNLVDYICVGM